jgi:hypothetical protein
MSDYDGHEYEERFELVRESIITHFKRCISENWERMFDMWLSCEADMVFGYGYQTKFKEQYSQYMNSDIDARLYLVGKNVVYAICAFMEYKKNAKLQDILNFTEMFVSKQLNDFGNWCGEISSAMYEESSECEREFGERKEDNPS